MSPVIRNTYFSGCTAADEYPGKWKGLGLGTSQKIAALRVRPSSEEKHQVDVTDRTGVPVVLGATAEGPGSNSSSKRLLMFLNRKPQKAGGVAESLRLSAAEGSSANEGSWSAAAAAGAAGAAGGEPETIVVVDNDCYGGQAP
eukprot:3818018-Rhodomonas_salina.1